MNSHTLPRPFRDPSERLLRGSVPPHFETFYRLELRHQPGARMRTKDVGDRYQRWAASVAAPGMSEKAICRAMINIGHERVRSNGMHFADVRRADQAPDLADNFPGQRLPAEAAAMTAAIDRIQTELNALRSALSKAEREIRGKVQGWPVK